jgi:hypothetical protein
MAAWRTAVFLAMGCWSACTGLGVLGFSGLGIGLAADDPVPTPPAPAPGPSAKPAPSLVPDKAEIDFGQAAQNQILPAEFRLKNTGATPVRVVKLLADCGCYDATSSLDVIPPGAEATVKVNFHTLVWSGPLAKKLRVLSDDPGRSELVVPLKVNIVAGVVVDPGRFGFGDVLKGEAPTKLLHVKWYEGVGKPFQVTGVEIPGHPDVFDVKTEPWSDGPWKGTRIALSFKQAPPLGMFSSVAIVRTDAPGYERLDLPVQAFVSGLVWVQERDVNMGWVRTGQGRSRQLSVRPFRRGGELGAVSATSREGKVRVECVPDATGRPEHWTLHVVVPAESPVGRLEDVVEVHTAVPGEELTEVKVRAEIMK